MSLYTEGREVNSTWELFWKSYDFVKNSEYVFRSSLPRFKVKPFALL